jgi:hypothetical protein
MGMSDLGYGFNILTKRAQPNLAPAFETGDDAAQARVEVAKCTPHSQKLPIADGMRPKRVGDRVFDVDPDFLRSHVLAVPISYCDDFRWRGTGRGSAALPGSLAPCDAEEGGGNHRDCTEHDQMDRGILIDEG